VNCEWHHPLCFASLQRCAEFARGFGLAFA
jgi:hypothetical protein